MRAERIGADGVAARARVAAGAVLEFEQAEVDAGVGQRPGGRQAGDAAADDRDARCVRCGSAAGNLPPRSLWPRVKSAPPSVPGMAASPRSAMRAARRAARGGHGGAGEQIRAIRVRRRSTAISRLLEGSAAASPLIRPLGLELAHQAWLSSRFTGVGRRAMSGGKKKARRSAVGVRNLSPRAAAPAAAERAVAGEDEAPFAEAGDIGVIAGGDQPGGLDVVETVQ